jgi:hypothetical protein
MNHKNYLATLITAAGIAASGSGFAADGPRLDGLTVNVGMDYSTGTYGGTDRNTVISIPMSAKYTAGRFILRLSVPWMDISGTGVVTSGIGGVGSVDGSTGSGAGRSSNSGPGSLNSGRGSNNSGSGSSGSGSGGGGNSGPGGGGGSSSSSSTSTSGGTFGTTRTTEQGFGDIVAALTYNAVDSGGLILDVTGKIKFPTGSEARGLSNGKTDYALLVEAEQTVGKAFVNGGIGHKWLGDPTGVTLRNPWFGAIGGGYKPVAGTTVGVSYDYSQSSRSSGTAGQEITLYASQRLTKPGLGRRCQPRLQFLTAPRSTREVPVYSDCYGKKPDSSLSATVAARRSI